VTESATRDDGTQHGPTARGAHADRPSTGDDLEDWPTGRLLSTAARMVEGAWTSRLAERGLTHAGVMALHELRARGELPLLELAQGCQVTAQTMSRTVDRLERDGLVVRRRSAADRRRVAIALPAAGTAAYADAADMGTVERELLGQVVDHAALRANLVAIVEHLRDDVPGLRSRR
jgi:DNA-binding MarR family transcriptional regulator